MGFRTVEIIGPAELHVRNGSLMVEKELKKERSNNSEGSDSLLRGAENGV